MEKALEPFSELLIGMARQYDRHFWVGESAPFDFTTANILGCTNFRLSPGHHRRYQVVWAYEQSPADLAPGQFELVFDELLRLIDDRGKLVVRFSQNDHFTVIKLKHFLGRRYNARIQVDHESFEDGVFTTVFDVRRFKLERYRDKRWTFAIVTQGKRKANVVRFLKSIRQFDPELIHEILVLGPPDNAYEPFDVRYMKTEYREHLAEISRKKNDIAEFATHPNLLIAHDRYVLDENFFAGFEQFGYDFDFTTVLQWYECGTRFPAYAALVGEDLTWSTPIDCSDYNSLRASQFLNGGLLVGKTDSFRDIQFNDMLFWNQAEDLELARAFRNHSLPPRVNCFASATTLGITPEYTKTFVPETSSKANNYTPKRKNRSLLNKETFLTVPILRYGKKVEQLLRPHIQRIFRKAS